MALDACGDNDGYSSAEEPLNSDPEEETRVLSAGRYTVVSDCEASGGPDLSVRTGDPVQLVKEGGDGQWLVQNLKNRAEPSQSCQSLTSSGQQ
ncbi:hypothetical protein CRUP_006423 [Coryphaenoides rupestris]|nr:hypothetical protein CRUP_006423 [Coryphaenoides rupestris]